MRGGMSSIPLRHQANHTGCSDALGASCGYIPHSRAFQILTPSILRHRHTCQDTPGTQNHTRVYNPKNEALEISKSIPNRSPALRAVLNQNLKILPDPSHEKTYNLLLGLATMCRGEIGYPRLARTASMS